MSEIDDLKARLAMLEPLGKAEERFRSALEAHRANTDDPAAKAEYRAAADELAALREQQRLADIEAGDRPAPGDTTVEGMAAPKSIEAAVAVPQPGGAK